MGICTSKNSIVVSESVTNSTNDMSSGSKRKRTEDNNNVDERTKKKSLIEESNGRTVRENGSIVRTDRGNIEIIKEVEQEAKPVIQDGDSYVDTVSYGSPQRKRRSVTSDLGNTSCTDITPREGKTFKVEAEIVTPPNETKDARGKSESESDDSGIEKVVILRNKRHEE